MNKAIYIEHNGERIAAPLGESAITIILERVPSGYMKLLFCGKYSNNDIKYWYFREVHPNDSIKIGLTQGMTQTPPAILNYDDYSDLADYYHHKSEFEASSIMYSDIEDLGFHLNTPSGICDVKFNNLTMSVFMSYEKGKASVSLRAIEKSTDKFTFYTWYEGVLNDGEDLEIKIITIPRESEPIDNHSHTIKTLSNPEELSKDKQERYNRFKEIEGDLNKKGLI